MVNHRNYITLPENTQTKQCVNQMALFDFIWNIIISLDKNQKIVFIWLTYQIEECVY